MTNRFRASQHDQRFAPSAAEATAEEKGTIWLGRWVVMGELCGAGRSSVGFSKKGRCDKTPKGKGKLEKIGGMYGPPRPGASPKKKKE